MKLLVVDFGTHMDDAILFLTRLLSHYWTPFYYVLQCILSTINEIFNSFKRVLIPNSFDKNLHIVNTHVFNLIAITNMNCVKIVKADMKALF